MSGPGTILRIGSDEVEFEGENVLIRARHKAGDWEVRGFFRTPIWFQGKKYFLYSADAAAAPFAWRYKLVPWPELLVQESPISHIYDTSFVDARDRAVRATSTEGHLKILLTPFYPFLGWAWSGFKERVLSPIGFEAKGITDASIFLEFCLMLTQAVYFGWLRGGMFQFFWATGTAWFIADGVLLVVLLADAVVRFSQRLLDEEVFPYGFLEWMVKIKIRPDRDAE